MAAQGPQGATPAPATRQWLTKRQTATVNSLLDAALEALRDVGYEGLSLRDVATRAGVTHTTAYNYFTSKEHLVAELNWRIFRELPTPEPDLATPLADRLTEALRGMSEMFSRDPELQKAVLASMVGMDPDIQRVRNEIGTEVLRRIEIAMGPDPDMRILDGVLLLYSGAMLQAGLGYFTFDEVVARMGPIIDMWGDATST
jgi:AcrR family transcriptional regulator